LQIIAPVGKNGEMDWLLNHPQRKTIFISAAIGAAVSTVFLLLVWAIFSKSTWRASGDGKTIFNSRTGELRYTASGRSVAEVNAEIKSQYAAQQSALAQAENKYKLEQVQRDQARENRRQQIRNHNSAIYYKVKKFVDDHPTVVIPPLTEKSPYANQQWESYTKPFRTGHLLDRLDHSYLLDFLGRAIKHEPYKSDNSFTQAIDELKKWDFSNSW
jgi:hypothetical protein